MIYMTEAANSSRLGAFKIQQRVKMMAGLVLISAFAGACSDGGGASSVPTLPPVASPPPPPPPPANTAPTVYAGPDQSVSEDETVQLAANVSDPDSGDTLVYAWAKLSGPFIQLNDPTIEDPAFIAPDIASPQSIELELSVSDGTDTVIDTVVINIAEAPKTLITNALHNGALVGADYWSNDPLILSAGMGFDNIVGIPEITEQAVRDAGGTWYGSVVCGNGNEPGAFDRTSAVAEATGEAGSKGHIEFDDGLPIVFSWPVATETADVSDFQFTLNTGEIVFPNAVTMVPNWELNERNIVVAFGDFGNRGRRDEADAAYPVRLDIVEDATPLLLIGPGGQEFNAVGLSWTTDQTPYDSGPVLVGAKLNLVDPSLPGEGGVPFLNQAGTIPNDELALYGGGDFRLRVLTSGGFSPDGVTGLRPNRYEDFFRLHAVGASGGTVLLEEVNRDYAVQGGTLRVLGLADLGQVENPAEGVLYDDCYQEDRDNYIDIILQGDEAAARNITFVEIPALDGGYNAFFNPGGPGPEPFSDVRYTAPGPADLEPVTIALDDPMRVDRAAR